MNPPLSNTESRSENRSNVPVVTDYSQRGQEGTLEEPAIERAREATICVVGLGYVGLPLAVRFAEANFDVVGFDVDESKVETLQNGVDTTGDLTDEAVAESGVSYTTEASQIADADYVIIAVPTPVDCDNRPDFDFVEAAASTVGSKMTAGATVILESTVYPGATREVMIPALEETSGMTAGEDFFVGYSPERATPGDEEHGLADVVKVVSGQTDQVLEDVAALYESVVDAGVHRAPSIEVAEASKVVENTQRDLNIAFVNELSMAFERLDVDTRAVLEAAGTKWNFHDYRPGLVGGHCIPVDPYFLAYQSEQAGFTPELIQTGRAVNEQVPQHVADLTIKALNECQKTLCESRVLVLGLSYKAGVGDIRSSKIANVVEKLKEYDIGIEGYDPFADADAIHDEFGIDVQTELDFTDFDAILLGTPHEEFVEMDLEHAAAELNEKPALVDVTAALDENAVADAGFVYRRV
ncbi:nucleotide sugar dehydrogenase [Natronosalvus caseinilyticus]|uniref:nucleotide sugar dehydrogenase n=1 Tax=Natronosalvus caseinilyticus TaxID=2953747 RepID=UPI0028AFDF4D|nr:nucleotide sugar dehydrogenase [Natronosalvus caseinilyticus]